LWIGLSFQLFLHCCWGLGFSQGCPLPLVS
jgi:hypothetical protein